jgi:sodium/hydrogen antiporter
VAFSPPAANFIRPLEYAGSEENLHQITLYFSRLVLGVQLVLAGVQLPSRYLKKQWKPLSLLIGPIMAAMWLTTSLLVWALVPNMEFLHALVVGSCVTPTDPVLSNVIVNGKFADHNVPKELQRIIIAESGANDGLGYPFLFFALYLIKYTGPASDPVDGGAAKAMGMWFGETLGYTILLSVVYGAVVGWLAKEALHWAESRKYVDRESFLVFAISLALFITGTCGMIGSDDVLACFIAGNVFTWDDWFRLETLDDSLQPTIDMLLNVTVFLWYGAVCPWDRFLHNDVIPLYRLVPLGLLVLLLRRLPWVLAIHKWIPQIEEPRQALFVGFFGPVGVSAIFYLYVTLEYIRDNLEIHSEIRADVLHLGEDVEVIVWFIAICSIVGSYHQLAQNLLTKEISWQVCHGLSIPLGKLGFYLPRTLSRASSNDEPVLPFMIGSRVSTAIFHRRQPTNQTPSGNTTPRDEAGVAASRNIYRIGGTLIPAQSSQSPIKDSMARRGDAQIQHEYKHGEDETGTEPFRGSGGPADTDATTEPRAAKAIRFDDISPPSQDMGRQRPAPTEPSQSSGGH